MTTTKTTLSDAPSVAGDDGEAIPETVESPTVSPVADTDGMSWYVACVRVNYEKKFMFAIEQDFQGRGSSYRSLGAHREARSGQQPRQALHTRVRGPLHLRLR